MSLADGDAACDSALDVERLCSLLVLREGNLLAALLAAALVAEDAALEPAADVAAEWAAETDFEAAFDDIAWEAICSFLPTPSRGEPA